MIAIGEQDARHILAGELIKNRFTGHCAAPSNGVGSICLAASSLPWQSPFQPFGFSRSLNVLSPLVLLSYTQKTY
jgi:hypothetical protein